jgi:Holliday junction resolvase RusA-like endonuclease
MSHSKGDVIFSLPPSVNSCWRNFKNRTILSKKYRQWREENNHIVKNGNKIEPFHWPVFVHIVVHPGKGWRKCDLDNRIKPILDQLRHCNYLKEDDTDHVYGVSISLGAMDKDFESYVSISFRYQEEE